MSRGRGKLVYVGNLPQDIRERDIEDLFGKVGQLYACSVAQDQHLHAQTVATTGLLQYGRIRNIDVKTPMRPPAFAFVEFEDSRYVVAIQSIKTDTGPFTLSTTPHTAMQKTLYEDVTATTFTATACVLSTPEDPRAPLLRPATCAGVARAIECWSRAFPSLPAGRISRYSRSHRMRGAWLAMGMCRWLCGLDAAAADVLLCCC